MVGDDMRILNVLSCLIDYPHEDVLLHKAEIDQIIKEAGLAPAIESKLLSFVEKQASRELLDCQSEYDGLFERGRSLALWLFEHVHGESRDRGQAMVELVNMYREAGLELDKHELPDYIPLFLEFLSTQGEENAKNWLQEMEHILGLLLCRLEKRGSDYQVLFEAVLDIAQSTVNLDEIRQQISSEKRDDTKKAIDKEWEEEEVTFGEASLEKSGLDKGCDSAVNRPTEAQRKDQLVPVNWVGFDTTPSSSPQSPSSSKQRG